MTDDTYELDGVGASSGDGGPAEDDGTEADAESGPGESVGIPVPDDHVAAFVAAAFEDAERDTDWIEVIDEVVADEAREAWDDLSPREQTAELIGIADEYDTRAVERLSAISLDRRELSDADRDRLDDAKRCRRNADRIRDGIADGVASGRVSDDDLVAAVEGTGFETDTIAEREDLLDTVTGVYDVDFRPYGGTLMDDGDGGVPEGEAW